MSSAATSQPFASSVLIVSDATIWRRGEINVTTHKIVLCGEFKVMSVKWKQNWFIVRSLKYTVPRNFITDVRRKKLAKNKRFVVENLSIPLLAPNFALDSLFIDPTSDTKFWCMLGTSSTNLWWRGWWWGRWWRRWIWWWTLFWWTWWV